MTDLKFSYLIPKIILEYNCSVHSVHRMTPWFARFLEPAPAKTREEEFLRVQKIQQLKETSDLQEKVDQKIRRKLLEKAAYSEARWKSKGEIRQFQQGEEVLVIKAGRTRIKAKVVEVEEDFYKIQWLEQGFLKNDLPGTISSKK